MSSMEISLSGRLTADGHHLTQRVYYEDTDFSGAVYQAVWNDVTGRPAGYGIKDYDLGYFDPDASWDAEDAVIAAERRQAEARE